MTKNNTRLNFPKKFLWGASISTHQVEGGNHNQWSVWEKETAKVKAAQARYRYGKFAVYEEIEKEAADPDNYISGQAADHFNRYEHDFTLAEKLHLNAVRSGIEWSRIEPREGKFDRRAIEHYKKYFDALRERDITPIITFWHWTMPEWFTKKGGFEKRRNVKYFVRYVKYVAERLGTHFEYVLILNEPTTYAGYSYHEGTWPPQKESKLAMYRVLRNLARAHRQSYKVIKNLWPKAKIGTAHNCSYFYPGDDSVITSISVWVANYFANVWNINQYKRHQDFLGLNWYWALRICGTRVHNPPVKKNDLDWSMEPDKLDKLMIDLYDRYKLPIMITETGVADSKDQYRKWWITEQIKALSRAMKARVKCIGYIHWSLLDNFEWAEGFWPRFGLIEVDRKTQQRKVRPSAQWYARFIKSVSDEK